MEQRDYRAGGAANTPPFDARPSAVETAADHQIPDETSPSHRAGGSAGSAMPETERELDRTRDMLAEAAAPVMARKTQEAISETADRLSHDPQAKQQMKRTAQALEHDATNMAKEKAGEMADRAETRVNQGMRQAAGRIDEAARRVDRVADERLSGGGMAGRAGEMAHSLADSMESVAGYLRDNDVQALRGDLERQLRERPLQTLLIAVAAGWVTGKILR